MAEQAEPVIPETMTSIVCHGIRTKLGFRIALIFHFVNSQQYFDGLGDYRVETLPVPTIGDLEVLIKVMAVGICASDAKCFEGAPMFWG
jgi:hypothetical protein